MHIELVKKAGQSEIQPQTNVTPSQKPSSDTYKDENTSKPKVKNATLSIDRIQVTLANLYPTRVTVKNTGDLTINPEFDLYVYKEGKEVCSGSPSFDTFDTIPPGEKKTDEISILGCMFEEDGEYTLKIDLLDSDYNKLDSRTKTFTVDYWGKFEL